MALSDWFQAEGEVLKQFILAFARRHSVAQASSPNARLSSLSLVKGPTQTRNKATTPDRGTVADDVRRRNPHPARPSTLRQPLRRLSAYEYHV